MSHTTPQTDEEWQAAVDMAHTYLLIDSARQYGLVEGGPVVNIARCEQLLRQGSERGTVPADDAVKRCMQELFSC